MSSRKEGESAHIFRMFNYIIIRGSRTRFPFSSRGFRHWFSERKKTSSLAWPWHIGPLLPGPSSTRRPVSSLILTRCAEQIICNNSVGRSLISPEGVFTRRDSTVSHDQQQTLATFGLPLRPPLSRASPPNVPHQPAGRATEMTQTRTCDVPGPHRTRFSMPCAGSVT